MLKGVLNKLLHCSSMKKVDERASLNLIAIINRQRATPVILTVMILPGETCADGEVNVNWMCVAVAFRAILLTQLSISVMHFRVAPAKRKISSGVARMSGLTYERDEEDAQGSSSTRDLRRVEDRETLFLTIHMRDPSSPAKSTRDESSEEEERRTGTATWQVSHGRTLIEKKEDMRERKKSRGRKKQGLVGRLRGMAQEILGFHFILQLIQENRHAIYSFTFLYEKLFYRVMIGITHYLPSHGYTLTWWEGSVPRGYLHEKNDFSQISKNFRICLNSACDYSVFASVLRECPVREDVNHILRGGGGLEETSGTGGATLRIIIRCRYNSTVAHRVERHGHFCVCSRQSRGTRLSAANEHRANVIPQSRDNAKRAQSACDDMYRCKHRSSVGGEMLHAAAPTKIRSISQFSSGYDVKPPWPPESGMLPYNLVLMNQ
ncbi:hypothetical protein G5I_02762 [Acromyrmex echinatior]|uniref:Uncharacterized protein n=1 Tax=Acromyrmex echinatior TaxID=103372 RepID=F4WB61_ACREC|nr:hypothetical protein G5I_02762 [Acromyrmex echinatior]